LIECLEQVSEALLRCWLAHSSGVRLSVLETVRERGPWQRLKRFIERYGGDLFTQRFMSLGNLRGILLQGVDVWLEGLEEEPLSQEDLRLLIELRRPDEGKPAQRSGRGIDRAEAAHYLSLILEAVVENYPEYIDYNSITTQSDHGEMLYTLLDFLRLRASYDRVAWNLQPLLWTHEVLVRSGRDDAAETWRQAVAGRTAEIADDHRKRFTRLSRKYGMRLPSIAQRLGERFVRPLITDRVRALVRPAMDQLRDGSEPEALRRLQEEIARLIEEPSGAGFEVPAWIQALAGEVDQVLAGRFEAGPDPLLPYLRLSQVLLSAEEAREQIDF